ncbi:MAG TPA: MFS transporter [Pinirhizobacter sp.]|uniref:MFS transporter n=1 Tax=Pinirhizobacter sp. TaxID=2950432 RepID=UPI002B990105|nr:MFS transporter [Pinirhizobacter sp.]HMH66295.1 MFS transporter [Pinirhizobacter sp.]
MSQFSLLRSRRFAPFFWTQALGAFNDNAFRNALVMLVVFQMSLGNDTAALYTNLAPALFILPFFLFSATAGQIAEKYEKSRIIRYVKLFEIFAMVVAAIGFHTHHVILLLVVLFLMGMHSTMFGPIKYSILPQALKPTELVGGNGLVEMGTQMAMLIGMIVGNALMLIAGVGPTAASAATIGVAVAGYLASRWIPLAPAAAPDLKVNFNTFTETGRVLRIARADKAVFNAILGISWFWFFGTVMIAQLPVYTRVNLGGDGSVNTLVLTLFSLGTGIGSLLCEKLSGKRVEVGLVPMGAFGLTAFGIDLYFSRPGKSPIAGLDWHGFLQTAGSWHVALDLTMIGVFAGFFVVPLFAFVQSRTPRDRLSRVIAGTNIINAIFICVASGLGLGLGMLGLSVPQIFLVTAVLNAFVAIYIFTLVPEFVMRFMTWVLVHAMYRVKATGLENIPEEGPVLLVCNHVSFLDPLVIMAGVRRPVRFVMYYKIFNIPGLSFIFRTAGAIPIAGRNENLDLMNKAFDAVDRALADGEVVCIFPEGAITRDGAIAQFRPGVETILARRPVPVVPLALRGMWGSFFSRRDSAMKRMRLPRRFMSRIELVGAPPTAHADASSLRESVSSLRGELA